MPIFGKFNQKMYDKKSNTIVLEMDTRSSVFDEHTHKEDIVLKSEHTGKHKTFFFHADGIDGELLYVANELNAYLIVIPVLSRPLLKHT